MVRLYERPGISLVTNTANMDGAAAERNQRYSDLERSLGWARDK